jgi:hypothetical protein
MTVSKETSCRQADVVDQRSVNGVDLDRLIRCLYGGLLVLQHCRYVLS